MIVFSAGGGTAVPIEIAQGAKARGLTVVAVTSVAQADVGEGPRLRDHADVVLDLCTPVGDALVELDGLETPVGPGSTIAAVALVNEIKVQTAALLLERGALPPVLTSPALVGAEESKRLFDAAYAEHARRAAPRYADPAGLPAASQRGRYSRAKSSFAAIVAAPITPARSSSAERRTTRSRVASGSERR